MLGVSRHAVTQAQELCCADKDGAGRGGAEPGDKYKPRLSFLFCTAALGHPRRPPLRSVTPLLVSAPTTRTAMASHPQGNQLLIATRVKGAIGVGVGPDSVLTFAFSIRADIAKGTDTAKAPYSKP